jgi:hypothetical protein
MYHTGEQKKSSLGVLVAEVDRPLVMSRRGVVSHEVEDVDRGCLMHLGASIRRVSGSLVHAWLLHFAVRSTGRRPVRLVRMVMEIGGLGDLFAEVLKGVWCFTLPICVTEMVTRLCLVYVLEDDMGGGEIKFYISCVVPPPRHFGI